MAGTSWSQYCPMCGGEDTLECWADNSQVEDRGCMCLECGYMIECTATQMSLHELNSERVGVGMEPLDELPKINI